MSVLATIPWSAAGTHPYVLARSGYDPYGRFQIECACQRCGEQWTKQCQHPQRRDQWIMHFCIQHAHGLQMRRA